MKAVLDMECPVEFGTVPDCDCAYEHWHIGVGHCLDIHFEPDGSIHVLLGGGDFENETVLHGPSLDAVRDEAFAWAAPLIGEAV
jgi:hypothetical protein